MFCPKCKYEYTEGIEVCPECGVQMVAELPVEEIEKEEKAFDPNEEICSLCTAADEFEAEIIIAKLRAEGVYAAKKFRSTDSYSRIILGRTIHGVEILVGKSSLELAREILKS